MSKIITIVKAPFVYLAIIFLYVIQIFVVLLGKAMLFLVKLPVILIESVLSLGITYWIVGQITAFTTSGRFLPLSYFDMSQYNISVQNSFIISKGDSIFTTFNWYVTPLIILSIIEIITIVFLNLYTPNTERSINGR